MTRRAPKKLTTADERPDRIPRNSVLFGKIIPLTLFFLGAVTLALVLFALGVIFGLVAF